MRNLIRIVSIAILCLMVSGFLNGTSAQVGTNNLFCPAIPFTQGMLELEISPGPAGAADFSAGMIGSIQRIIGRVSGGIDWMPSGGPISLGAPSAPSNEAGSQLISWWSTANNRSTKIQVSNMSDNTGPHTSGAVLDVHVQIFDSNCLEIRDFCDQYTPYDTHVYDLGGLVTNDGITLGSGSLADKEGIIVVTAVENCGSTSRAIEHNFLSGNMYVSDTLKYTYTTNMFARKAECTPPGCTGILTGSSGSALEKVQPAEIFGLFNRIVHASGSDVIVMNIKDQYTPSYLAVMPASIYTVGIINDDEVFNSCGSATACFMRLGVDSALPARQDLGPPFPSP